MIFAHLAYEARIQHKRVARRTEFSNEFANARCIDDTVATNADYEDMPERQKR